MSSYDDSFHENNQFTKVFEGVGSLGAIFVCPTTLARDLDVLKENGISAVVSAQKDEQVNLPKKQIPYYLYLQLEDDIQFNIATYFQQSFKFIEQNRRRTHILIHCQTGINCSVSLVIAYLIKKYQYTYHEAITLVKRRYKLFNIMQFNPGFAHRLEYYAVQKGDFNLVQQNHLRRRIQRIRRTYGGIARSYSKELTKQQKLQGQSPKKGNRHKYSKSNISTIKYLKSESFIPEESNCNIKNPEQKTDTSFRFNSQFSKQYTKYLPQKSQQQLEDQQHHKKIISQIFLLSEQSKMYMSKRMQSIRSDNSVMKNYDRLKSSKKNHLTFYSPLKKLQKYQMFTQGKLNKQFYAFMSTEI